MSSITKYKLKNGKSFYRVQYTVGYDPLTGKPQRKQKRGFKTQREAKLWSARATVDIDNHGFTENKDITYKEVYDDFIESYKKTVKESTLNHVLGIFRIHILPIFGKKKIKKITIPMCQKVVNDWSENFADYKKIKNYANLVFKMARRLSIIYENPMDLIIMPKDKPEMHKSGDEKFWDKEELQTFLEQTVKYYGNRNEKAIALFRLIAFTGARKAEILALQVADFDYDEKTLLINKTVTRDIDNKQVIGTPKTINGYRTLYLDQYTADLLHNWIIRMRKEMLILGYNTSSRSQWIFPNESNNTLSLMKPNKWIDTVISSYNANKDNKTKLKRITPHGLRHTFVTIAIESKKLTLKQIQEQVGDSDISVIMNIYAHVTKKASKETIDSFTSYVGF
ncbi:site-specific integrase [Companilactobacillus allii]|uniref:Site-specific integrase n=1 Tax=Companilactobacillus allii TaxID=1847728 RepID=A0A1P8Q5L9_9LACO|nr:site-specific integrase [Companilactobacillus allii]APX73146.1 site-specific integrase [Companilactobacillus allii]USQ67950.1 site-specific integrase [Companilactobacillus allii]